MAGRLSPSQTTLNATVVLSFLKSRRVIAVLSTTLIFILLLQVRSSTRIGSSYFNPVSSSLSSSKFFAPPSPPSELTEPADTQDFWPQFYSALLAATPRCALPHRHIEAAISLFRPGSRGNRQNLINLDDADVSELTSAHTWFVEEISSPTFPKPYFVPGSMGVVTTAGGEFLPEAIVAIRMLRRTGSTLPVDVFMASPEELEGDICETIMPALGARCHVLSEVLDKVQGGLPHRHTITKYQLKAFALLLSEFDNMVWIDADQIPVIDPREVLEAEPMRSRGLVTWPDYWYMTSSPLFYRVANVSEENIPNVGDRAASETGQLLISKTLHLRTLELVTYYNFHGYSHYYKLLSQGAIGEGDKETFLAAAAALGTPYWAVRTPIDTIGWHTGDGDFKPTGMLQADPRKDFAHYAGENNNGGNGGGTAPAIPPAFLHDEQHKPNAGRYSRLWRDAVRQRMWMPVDDMIRRFGYDIEKAVWDEIVWTACGAEFHGHVFQDWVSNTQFVDEGTEVGDVCTQAKAVYKEMFNEDWKDQGAGEQSDSPNALEEGVRAGTEGNDEGSRDEGSPRD